MNIPPILRRRRSLRWLVPLGVAGVAVIAGTGAFGNGGGSGSAALPNTSPAALLAQVRNTDATSFSGTVVSHIALGLPQLPNIGGGPDDTSLATLLSGSHTLQLWYGGVDQQRIALLGATDETDIFHNGRDLWQWSSANHTANHIVLPAGHDVHPVSTATALTPAELARRAIAEVNPTTRVAVGPTHTVADRAVYDLVLTPRTTASLVGSVHIEVDGKTKVPLGVQVYARAASTPAIDVAFTTVHFGPQSDRNFEFTPPPNATVHANGSSAPGGGRNASGQPEQTGSGWTRVVSFTADKSTVRTFGHGIVQKATKPVSGAWGKGQLLESTLLSVLLTRDGRVFAGAVEPAVLYAAAAK